MRVDTRTRRNLIGVGPVQAMLTCYAALDVLIITMKRYHITLEIVISFGGRGPIIVRRRYTNTTSTPYVAGNKIPVCVDCVGVTEFTVTTVDHCKHEPDVVAEVQVTIDHKDFGVRLIDLEGMGYLRQ